MSEITTPPTDSEAFESVFTAVMPQDMKVALDANYRDAARWLERRISRQSKELPIKGVTFAVTSVDSKTFFFTCTLEWWVNNE